VKPLTVFLCPKCERECDNLISSGRHHGFVCKPCKDGPFGAFVAASWNQNEEAYRYLGRQEPK
jgi:hypothetical protein